jgi:hypothetical protein
VHKKQEVEGLYYGILHGNGLAYTGMCDELFNYLVDWFFTEYLFDFLRCELELLGDEAKLLKQCVEAESQRC